VDTQGDGFFVVFPSATACASAAIEIQRALEAHSWPPGERVRVRMGMHSGEASETPSGLIGFDVHRAARVAGVGYGGQILVSETTATLVRDRLPEGASLRDLGLHRLKDLGRPQQIFQLDAAGLEPDFGPLRSLDNPLLSNNLPAQSASFIGRDHELEETRALLDSARLVTLTGAGGCGKTRLALELATESLDGSRDGVWLVELAAVAEPDDVTTTVAGALGVRGRPGGSELENLLDTLGPQDTLIVLDNCEHVLGVCAQVSDAILRRCPKVQLLATSREPLGVAGETVYRVPSLSLPSDDEEPEALAGSDAIVLFLERARAQGVDLRLDRRSGPALASTCRRLDGMPLAIELAAARLRSLSIFELHDLLDQRFRLLTGGSRAALERQQTLRATVDWSYSLLTEAERTLLRRLSVFTGGFDLEAAGVVCAFGEIERFDVADLLGSLVDKSLVGADQSGERRRYGLLETIRQFAAERLIEGDPSEPRTLAEAHGRYFLELAEAASTHLRGPDPGPWFARLDADQANIRRAIERASEDPEKTSEVLRFTVALGYYFFTRAQRREALGLVMPALGRPEARDHPELFARALVFAAGFAIAVDGQSADRLIEEAVTVAREIDDKALQVWTLLGRVGTRRSTAEPEAAMALAEHVLARARAIGDNELICSCGLAAIASCNELDPVRAGEIHREIMERAERSGNLLLTHDLHTFAGYRALDAGDLPEARFHLARAAEVGAVIGAAPQYVAIPRAMVSRAEGNGDAAGEMLADVIRTTRRVGDHPGLGFALMGVACLAGDRACWPLAAELHGASRAILDHVGHPPMRYEPYRQASIETVRANLGDEEFERLYARGRALELGDAIALAQKSPTGVRSEPASR
jgi:predicted ATPase